MKACDNCRSYAINIDKTEALCDVCYLRSEIDRLTRERDEALVIVDRLSYTADGVPLIADMVVWHELERYAVLAVGACDCWIAQAENREVRKWAANDKLHSTREAAEQARQPCNP